MRITKSIHVYNDIAFGYRIGVGSLILSIGYFIIHLDIKYSETRRCYKKIWILKYWNM